MEANYFDRSDPVPSAPSALAEMIAPRPPKWDDVLSAVPLPITWHQLSAEAQAEIVAAMAIVHNIRIFHPIFWGVFENINLAQIAAGQPLLTADQILASHRDCMIAWYLLHDAEALGRPS